MFENEIMIVVVAVVAGIVFGVPLFFFVKRQIESRAKANSLENVEVKKYLIFLFPVALAVIFFLMIFVRRENSNYCMIIENGLYILVGLGIAYVDLKIKMIPNESLLSLLVIRIVFLILILVGLDSTRSQNMGQEILFSLLGFVVAFVVVLVPSLLKIPIGGGDIKYCAVLGFCLSLLGYMQAMVVMAVTLILFYIVLKLSGKGGLRTSVPMGPFLTVGVIMYSIVPFLSGLS